MMAGPRDRQGRRKALGWVGRWVGPTQKSSRHLKMQAGEQYTAQRMPINYHTVQVQGEVSEMLSKSSGISETTGHAKSTRTSKRGTVTQPGKENRSYQASSETGGNIIPI